MSAASERTSRANQERERKILNYALATWTHAEVKAEELRHPAYERWLVEQAEQTAKRNREAKGVR